MSSHCERVFSQAKRVITDDRNQLGSATIEAIQCQNNWLDNSELAAVMAQVTDV